MALLRSAHEAKHAHSEALSLAAAPDAFSGDLEELAARYILPALPAVDLVIDVHRHLLAHVEHADPLFLIRHIRGTERRHDYQTRDGIRIRATDNSPAWWMYASLRAGHRIAPDSIAAVIESIPCHMFDVAPRSAPVPNNAGWHIAHILNVNDRNVDYSNWSRREVVRRFIRNIHPANYFLLPKVDWQRLGNDADIVNYFASIHRERYASIWGEFAELAEFDRPLPAGSLGGTRVEFGGDPERTRAAVAKESKGALRTTRRRTALKTLEVPVRIAVSGQSAEVTYRATRLLFRRDLIEPLPDSARFRVLTPAGDFEMSKADFHAVFPGVVLSRSYREGGIYHFPSPPKRADQFRV